ncbi:MAG TPA: ABC transporter ATP-binding protein [Chloroflexota bacterium]|nr:ABC transporter ATP-binding protein [Chloroflexota bacterium]
MLVADIEASAGAFRLRAALTVERGKTLVLFGPSGAGKTMVLRSLAGIHPHVRGRIVLDGETILDSQRRVDVPPQGRGLGYVPQSYALFPHLTVAENVAFGLSHCTAAERRRRVEGLLDTLQLEGLATRRPAQLSGGQQQRVALARALAIEPRVLLLDEPLAALDAPLRRLLRRELQTLRHRFGFAMLFVTHDLGDACALGDEIAVVDGGRIVQRGRPQEILYRPATPAVARLTGMRNVFPARVTAALDGALEVTTERFTVRTPPYPFPPGAAVQLYVRPEHVVLIRPEHEAAPHRGNLVRGQIVDELHLGPVHTLYLRLLDRAPAASPGGHTAVGSPAARGEAAYDLEVDLAPHPYQALHVAERREWLLSLVPEALHLTPLDS